MICANCANCAAKFAPSRDWGKFCTPVCRKKFHDVMLVRGQVLTPLRLVAHGGKHVPSDLARYARREADALEAAWNVEDRACGRNPAAGVMQKMQAGWKACDL